MKLNHLAILSRFFIAIVLLTNISVNDVNALEKYNFNISSVVYNATTGIVTIYDSSFTNPPATGMSTSCTLSKIRVGGITPSGNCPYNYTGASINIVLSPSGRDDLNRQPGFDRNGTVANGIIFEDSAICRNQSTGINGQATLGCYNAGSTNVTVEGYYGPTVISSFTANQTRFTSSGGLLTLTVRGNYLFTVGSNVVINDGTRDNWPLPGAMSSTTGTFSFNLPANTSAADTVYTYTVYSRNHTHLGATAFTPSNNRISITVLGINSNTGNNSPTTPNNDPNKNTNNNSNSSPNSSNEGSNSDENNEEIIADEKLEIDNMNQEEKTQDSIEIGKVKSNKSKIIISLIFSLIIISGIVFYFVIKKKKTSSK